MFSMNGGTGALALNLMTRLGVVADFTAVHLGMWARPVKA